MGALRGGTIPLSVHPPTHTLRKEEGKEEEEEVPEGGECGVLVWVMLKLLLQHRLFFHWLLCGPARFCAVDKRGLLLHIHTEGGHGANRFRLILRLTVGPLGTVR